MLIVTMMIVSPLSIAVDTASGELSDDEKEDILDAMKLVDNGDGTFTITNNLLKEKFNLPSMTESEVKDILGTRPLTSEPQEIVEWYGDPVNSYGVFDIVSGATVKDDFVSAGVNTDSYHSVGFSAALSKGMAVENDSGLHKQDWFCSLYYDNSSGALKLTVTNVSGNNSTINVDGAVGTSPYSINDINLISSMQSKNILNYAVGDFDGDGNEEIAVHHYQGIYIFGVDSGNALKHLYSISLPTLEGCKNTIFTPVSMAAGDTDRDLFDELVVARGYLHGGEVGNEQTIICCIDVNKQTGGGRFSFPSNITEISWKILKFNDPKNETSTLDSVMTSVSIGDIDCDGWMEVVIGGYLWDISARNDPMYYNNPERSAGELYLAYFEYEKFFTEDTPWNKPTILTDDDGTATTRFISGNEDFEKRYVLNENHNRLDTSIYLHDYGNYSDNPTGLCRSVNWSNWTIPMCTGSLSGFMNSAPYDQVFFDTWFYNLSTDVFSVYNQTPKFSMVMDNNNVMCNYIGFETLYDQDAFSYSGQKEVIIHYAADLEDKTKDTEGEKMKGATEWAYVIYDYDGNVFNTKYSTATARTYHDIREWGENGLYNVGRVFVGNYDNDTFYADIVGKLSMYSDPMVIAFISGIPYEKDLVDQLQKPGAIGSTTFVKTTSQEVETTSTYSYYVGGYTDLDVVFQQSIEGGFRQTLADTTTSTVEISQMFTSSEDSVALFVIPVDFYFYNVFEPSKDGNYKLTVQVATQIRDEVTTTMGYDEYCDLIDEYNQMGELFYEEDFIPLGKINVNDHVTGDISSYKYLPPESEGTIKTQNVNYGSATAKVGDEPEHSVCVDVGSATGHTNNNAGFVNGKTGVGIGFKDAFKISFGSIGGYEETHGTTTVDATGEGFTSTMYGGFASYYLGEEDEYEEVMSQYWMEGKFWAERRSIDNSGESSEYIHVGYAVTHYDLGAAIATLSPQNQPGIPYGPTDDSVCLYLEHPNAGVDPLAMADSYSLETNWHETGWKNVSELGYAGIVIEKEVDGAWVACNGIFEVQDDKSENTNVWIRVSGLSSVTDTDFEFRVVGYKDEGKKLWVPSIPVTAYKDTRINDAHQITVGTEEGVGSHLRTTDGKPEIVIDYADVKDIIGQKMLALNTTLSVGDRANIYLKDGDMLRSLGYSVSDTDGVFYLQYEGEEDKTASITIGAVAAVVISLIVVGIVTIRGRQ